ncbi:MAG: hypothetical protein PF505_15255, partial [Vallitaleaceae bacterium]|nr:hypothetical protein [Vallitaleaceae bacterium]
PSSLDGLSQALIQAKATMGDFQNTMNTYIDRLEEADRLTTLITSYEQSILELESNEGATSTIEN